MGPKTKILATDTVLAALTASCDTHSITAKIPKSALATPGFQTFQRPRVEVQNQWGYKNEVLDGPGLDLLHILVPLYGGSLFTIGIFNLTAFFLFEIKESSYVLLASGICFWLGTIFVRSTFSEKTLNHYKKGRKEVLTFIHTLGWLIYKFSNF